jgi:hypothetical protein
MLLGLVGARQQQVDAERHVAELPAEPDELLVEVVDAAVTGTEHAHAAGPRHRGDNLLGVREREQRLLDLEQFGDLRVHRRVPSSRWPPLRSIPRVFHRSRRRPTGRSARAVARRRPSLTNADEISPPISVIGGTDAPIPTTL